MPAEQYPGATTAPEHHLPGVHPLPLEVMDVSKYFGPGRLSRMVRRAGTAPLARRRRPKAAAKPRRAALDGVSFKVPEGEIYGVLGANGSGKSTLIRILSTLLLPDRGTVKVFGHDAVRDPGAVRPLINRVSVDPSFFKPMSALENLMFFGRVYGMTASEVRQASGTILRRLGVGEEHAREPMLHLSCGQQQKVAVARAFLSTPRLMLLDEPTTGSTPAASAKSSRSWPR